MFIQLAFKNITRNPKRTLITLSAVFCGVLLIIVGTSFNEGLGARAASLYINADSGAAKVVSHNYELENVDNPLDYPIKDYQKIIHKLKSDKRIKAISPRITFRGSLSNGKDEISLTGIGVDPFQEDQVFNRSGKMIAGSFFKGKKEGVVIGQKLSKILNVGIGDSITVIARATQMGYNATDMEIVGLIKTDNPIIDENSFFISLDSAKDFLSFIGITDIAISLKRLGALNSVKKDFNKQTRDLSGKLMSWAYFARDYLAIIDIQNMKIAVLSLTILLMAGAGIANTMLMAMMERKKEVANFMAQGVRRSNIIKLFLFEGLAIGFIGSFIGVLAGGCLVGILRAIGASFSGAPPVFNPVSAFIYFLIGLLLAAFSTIYPAEKASKLLPAEVLRDNLR